MADEGWARAAPSDRQPCTLVLAFAAPEFGANRRSRSSRRRFELLIAGCSTRARSPERRLRASVSVAIARFEHSDLRRAFTARSDRRRLRTTPARDWPPSRRPWLRAVFVLPTACASTARRWSRACRHLPEGPSSPAASPETQPSRAHLILDRAQPEANRAAPSASYGAQLRWPRCEGGWPDFGPERRITRRRQRPRARRRRRWRSGKTYLGERAHGLLGPRYSPPGARRAPERRCAGANRLAVDEAQHRSPSPATCPVSAVARLMRANTDSHRQRRHRAAPPRRRSASDDALCLAVASAAARCLANALRRKSRPCRICPWLIAHVGFYSYGDPPALPGGASDCTTRR